jgi:hypothetical protein
MRPRFWILLLAPAIVQVLGDGGTVKYFTDKACKSQAGSGAYTLSGHQDDIYCDNVDGLANIGSIIVTNFNFTCDDPKQPMLKLYNAQDCPTADVDVMPRTRACVSSANLVCAVLVRRSFYGMYIKLFL